MKKHSLLRNEEDLKLLLPIVYAITSVISNHAQNVDSNEIQISDLRDLAASLKHEYYTQGHMIYEYGKGKLSLLLLMLYLGHV